MNLRNLVRAFVVVFAVSSLVGCAADGVAEEESAPTVEVEQGELDTQTRISKVDAITIKQSAHEPAAGDVNGDGVEATGFHGGVNVAAGDVNGDGIQDARFRGGVRVATGDVNGDGRSDP